MKPYYEHAGIKIFNGDVMEVLPAIPSESVQCCVTSPPYWGLRDYGVEGQLGLERTPAEYICKMVRVFAVVKRVLRDDGTLWLNMGDSYANPSQPGGGDPTIGKRNIGTSKYRPNMAPGLKAKDLCGIPWMLAFALRADGWYLRSDIIWHKLNPMPESVTDRPTKAHEYLFLLSKSEKYYYDQNAIREPVSENTHMRLSQDLANQIGSARANGNTRPDRPMKAVGRKAAGANSRIYQDGDPNHLTARKIKHNASYDAAVCLPVTERNKRTVWSVATQAFAEAHFATFPEELIQPCILAGSPAGGTVLDPFFGSGTTGLVAARHHCKCIGIELNQEYIEIAAKRLSQGVFDFSV